MFKALAIVALYALAFGALYLGTLSAPATGWTVTSAQVNGCCLLILGVMLKAAGHAVLLSSTRR